MVNYKNWLKIILLVLGVIILVVFLRKVDLTEIINTLNVIEITNFLFLITITFTAVFIKAIRWAFLNQKISGKKIELWFSLKLIIAGVACSSIFPGRLELAKPLMLKEKYQIKLAHSLSALTSERVFDLLSLLILLAFALFLIPLQEIINKSLILFLLVMLLLLIFFMIYFSRAFSLIFRKILKLLPISNNFKLKISEFVTLLLSGFSVFKNKKIMIFTVFFSLIALLLEAARFYFLLLMLQIDLSYAIVIFVFSATVIISVFSAIPGGIGITEMSTAALLSLFLKNSPELINSAILIDRFIAYYLLLILGGIIMITYSRKHLKTN